MLHPTQWNYPWKGENTYQGKSVDPVQLLPSISSNTIEGSLTEKMLCLITGQLIPARSQERNILCQNQMGRIISNFGISPRFTCNVPPCEKDWLIKFAVWSDSYSTPEAGEEAHLDSCAP